MKTRVVLGMAVGINLASGAMGTVDAKAYVQQIETWRTERAGQLTAPTGWLTLIGLHFLQVGDNTVGSAPDNSVVLAKGPAHLAKINLGPTDTVAIAFETGLDAKIDGNFSRSGELASGAGIKPTVVSIGTVSFFVIERGGRKALRVRDSEAERRTHFLGIDYFPIDPTWRIEAQWVPFAEPREIAIENILGNVSQEKVPGKAVFTRGGHTYELLPILEGPDEPLFFVISDQTSGRETYGAARFLYAELPKDGKVLLDFNRAENPPCAFTPFATCPLPPKENRLPLAIAAGEKNYRGAHP